MKKQKTKFHAFLITLAVSGLVPWAALAQDTPALAKSVQNVDFGASNSFLPEAAKVAISEDAPKARAGEKKESPKKHLSLAEAKNLIPDLQITLLKGDERAVMTGLYAPACDGKFEVLMQTIDGVTGFTLLDKGGFKSCVETEKADCGAEDACHSLSSKSPKLIIDRTKNTKIAYLKKVGGDSELETKWIVDGQVRELKSAEEIAAEEARIESEKKAKAQQEKIQDFMNCTTTRTGLEFLRDMLGSSGIEDQAALEKIAKAGEASEIKFANQDLDAFAKKVALAIEKNQVDEFAGLEDSIYDELLEKFAKVPGSSNRLADLILKMAAARTNTDDATSEGVELAAKSLDKALHELKLSPKKKAEFEAGLNVGIPNARLQVAYGEFAEIRDSKGPQNRATGRAYEKFLKMAKAENDSLKKQAKAMGCIDRFGGYSQKRMKDEKLDDACGEIEARAASQAEIPAIMEQQHAQAMVQRQQQAAAGRQVPQGIMQQMQQQQAQQMFTPNPAQVYGGGMPGAPQQNMMFGPQSPGFMGQQQQAGQVPPQFMQQQMPMMIQNGSISGYQNPMFPR